LAEISTFAAAGQLVLVRPDRHIAWRGNAAPADPAALLDRVAGC